MAVRGGFCNTRGALGNGTSKRCRIPTTARHSTRSSPIRRGYGGSPTASSLTPPSAMTSDIVQQVWLAALAVTVLASTAYASPRVVRYAIVDAGTEVGQQTCSIISPRERICEWSFVDRGLGPKLKAHIVVDERGLPVLIENTGLDYTHNQTHERFTRTSFAAEWHSGKGEWTARRRDDGVLCQPTSVAVSRRASNARACPTARAESPSAAPAIGRSGDRARRRSRSE